MSAAASHRAEVGLRACCWVWCARVQSVGPCSRYVCSLRCARVRVRARRDLRSTRYVQSQARRECSKSRSSTGARAPGTPHACAGNGWGRCGARARARTGVSPPRSRVDGSCTALEASVGKTPWLLAASVGWAGARRSIASDLAVVVGTRARCSVPSEAVCQGARLSSGCMGRVAPSAKIVFLRGPLFFTKFHKNAFFKRGACSVTLLTIKTQGRLFSSFFPHGLL